MKDLYSENYKTLNKGDRNKCPWFGRINIVNMSLLLKEIYRCNAILIKNTNFVLLRMRTANPKIYMELQRSWNSQRNFEKEQSDHAA